MTKGLVSKGRTQRKSKMISIDNKLREETKQNMYGSSKKKLCKCGFETGGLLIDNKMCCPRCKEVL